MTPERTEQENSDFGPQGTSKAFLEGRAFGLNLEGELGLLTDGDGQVERRRSWAQRMVVRRMVDGSA